MPVVDLTQIVQQWARRARLQRSLQLAGLGLASGIGLALLVSLASRVTPLLTRNVLIALSIGLTIVGLLAGLLYPWLRAIRRSTVAWAREFDARFGLHERVSTALELTDGRIPGKNDGLRRKQIDDTEHAVGAVDANTQIPLRLSRRDLIVSALFLAALIIVLVLPNPQDRALAEREKMRSTLQQQAQQLEQAKKDIAASSLSEAQKKAATQALEDAQRALNDPNATPEQALAALNQAQAKLDALQDQATRDAQRDLSQAGQSLSSDELTNALSDSLQNGEYERAADQLRQLGQRDNGQPLSPEENQRVAQQLDQMARQVQNSDPAMADQLREAAQQLREGRTEEAQQSLQQAAQSLEATAQNASNNQQLEQAGQQAEQTRQTIAQAARDAQLAQSQSQQQSESSGNSPNDQSQSGQTGGDTQSAQAGSSGQQEGQAGQTAAGGQAENGAPAAGNQQGSSATGGDASSGSIGQGRKGHSEDTGSDNSVYAPGRLASQGRQVVLPDTQGTNAPNPNGQSSVAPDGDASVPYQEVFSAYADAADEALQTDQVPADRRDYVRDYFSSLDPNQNDQP